MATPTTDELVELMMNDLRKHFAELDRAVAIEEAVKALGLDRQFTNAYECDTCGSLWKMQWSCACDDKCPNCGEATSPYYHSVSGEEDAND